MQVVAEVGLLQEGHLLRLRRRRAPQHHALLLLLAGRRLGEVLLLLLLKGEEVRLVLDGRHAEGRHRDGGLVLLLLLLLRGGQQLLQLLDLVVGDGAQVLELLQHHLVLQYALQRLQHGR